MRIAVDARELEERPTGVGRVLEGLLRAWPEGGDDLVLACRRRPGRLAGIDARVARRAGPRRLPGFLWEQAVLPGLLGRIRPDLLLAPAYGMPLRAPCPTLVGMHDCAFAALPDTFGWRERWRRRLAARIAARHAALLFTGSAFAAAEIRRWLGVDEDRIVVLPYGVDPRFRPAPAEAVAEVRRRYRLRRSLVLFVGSVLARRDLSSLDRVVAELARTRTDLELGIVGIAPEEPPELQAGRWLGYVPDADLPALYSAATVVAYPSRYEGFGLPVLEALACDTPVVASAAGSLPEIFGEHATLVPTADSEQWQRALAELLDSPEARRMRIATAGPWARSRTWSAAAARLRDLMAEIAEGAP